MNFKRRLIATIFVIFLLTGCQSTPITEAVGQSWQYQPFEIDDPRFDPNANIVTFIFNSDGTFTFILGSQIAAYVVGEDGVEREEVQSVTESIQGNYELVDNEIHFTLSWSETGRLLRKRTKEMPAIVDSAATDQIKYRLFWRNGNLNLQATEVETVTLRPIE